MKLDRKTLFVLVGGGLAVIALGVFIFTLKGVILQV